MIECTSTSPGQTIAIGRSLGSILTSGDVVLLDGPLGSGKTCFVKGIAEGMGIDQLSVSSPTYVLCQEYGPVGEASTLVHIDAYRVSSAEDLEDLGWDDLLLARDKVIVLEWPGHLYGVIPTSPLHVLLEHVDEQSRIIRFNGPDSWLARLSEVSVVTDVA